MTSPESGNSDKSDKCYGSFKYTKTVPSKDGLEIRAYWIIPDFMKLYNDVEDNIISPPIVLCNGELELQLGVTPVRSKNKMKIIFKFWSPTQDATLIKSVQLKMFTFDKSNWVYDQEQSIFTWAKHVIYDSDEWFWLTKSLSISDSQIFDDDKDKMCPLRHGSLHLDYEFLITSIEYSKEYQFQIPPSKLNNDMENLFLDCMYTDVVMKSSDNEEFQVHKAVLANRCAVLKAHFKHNTTESITNIVESPIESTVLHEVLSFIYTDKAPKVDEFPEKLLAAADFYQLTDLKRRCEKALFRKLTVDNAIEILQLADLHSADTLRQLTLDFIQEQLKLIIKTAGWAKLKSVDLLKKITESST